MGKFKCFEKDSFGELLSDLIAESGMSKTDFYIRVGITKTYLYEVLNGRITPPNVKMQYKMSRVLKESGKVKEDSILKLYDKAAEKRGEPPADIFFYSQDEEKRAKLRKVIKKDS